MIRSVKNWMVSLMVNSPLTKAKLPHPVCASVYYFLLHFIRASNKLNKLFENVSNSMNVWVSCFHSTGTVIQPSGANEQVWTRLFHLDCFCRHKSEVLNKYKLCCQKLFCMKSIYVWSLKIAISKINYSQHREYQSVLFLFLLQQLKDCI